MTDLEYLDKYYKGDKKEALKKLKQGIPVQYIVGVVDFYGNILEVNENVLIPRFETEELVEKTINYIKKNFQHKIDIADIGTGSGCIAITLKNNIDCNIDAVDISASALEVAKRNAKDLEINFIEGNLLEPLTKKYDVIISNPPYIAHDEEIMEIVKNNEPHIALYASNKGLKCYEEMLKNIKQYLKNKSLIAFEIGCNQGNDIMKIAKKYLPNSIVNLEKDLQGKDRFIFVETNN